MFVFLSDRLPIEDYTSMLLNFHQQDCEGIINVKKVENLQSITTTNNHSHNTTNNNNATMNNATMNNDNSTNVHISINPYGKEKIDYIEHSFIRECLALGAEGDVSLFERTHFSIDHPENRNIKIKDLSRNKLSVCEGENDAGEIWKPTTKMEVIKAYKDNICEVYECSLTKLYEETGNLPIPMRNNYVDRKCGGGPIYNEKLVKGITEVLRKNVGK